ncbi:MAG: alcohol dehydrogenase catalytic domain-containing protein [Acidobacteriaceae bacterium]
MIAAVYHGPEDLRLEEWPMPSAAPGEAVVRIDCASICATDLRILRGVHRKYGPGTVRVPGHEVVGTIAEVGAQSSGAYRVGQRVFVAPNIGCGHCRQCLRGQNNLCANYDALGITLDGAFAEYMRVPPAFLEQGNLIPFDSALDGAAVALAEPFACVLRGQEALNVGSGDVVLILGAGPIGIMHTIAARAADARKIIVSERSAQRRYMATAVGATRTVSFQEESLPDVVAEETDGCGADVIIVAAGVREAMEGAPALAAIGGRINLFAGLPVNDTAITLDSNLIHYKELTVTGTTGCSTDDCRRSMELITSGKVNLASLISRRYRLDQVSDAFSATRAGNMLKVVLEIDSKENL